MDPSSPEQLEKARALAASQHARLQSEINELGLAKMRVETLSREADQYRLALERVSRSLERAATVQSSGSRGINIVSAGDQPVAPSSDKRWGAAVALALFGLILGMAGLVLLLAVTRLLR